ncbi:MAG: hypothetical protein AMXMBFR57_32130 [Acidimicrobiia bacterium]
MKTLPTVVAGVRNGAAIILDGFDDVLRAPNRDAVDYIYRARSAPTADQGFLVVRFSGTVTGVRPADFGLPEHDDRRGIFQTFAEAVIGDVLDEKGEVPIVRGDQSGQTIDCFSPHFQAWHDRAAATDDQVEQYLIAHVVAAWRFNLQEWRVGSSDMLRLRRPWPDLLRMIALRQDQYWALSDVADAGVTLNAMNAFIRQQLEATRHETPPAMDRPVTGAGPAAQSPPAVFVYVDESRIADLRAIESLDFDLRKLIAICEELNQCYRGQCYHAVAALTRALVDHVPPLFGVRAFSEVANNYAGSRSFRSSMQQLDTAARTIADRHLHTQVRNSEVLPTRVQVDFSQVVDVLLAEVIRRLQPRGTGAA